MDVAPVGPRDDSDLRRVKEMNALDGLQKLPELRQAGDLRRVRAEFPRAHQGSVGERAGQSELGVQKPRLEMVQFPLIVWQETQFRHDAIDLQQMRGLLRLVERPGETAFAQDE